MKETADGMQALEENSLEDSYVNENEWIKDVSITQNRREAIPWYIVEIKNSQSLFFF